MNVLTLNPVAVQIEDSNTQSLLECARDGDLDAFCEICRIYEHRLLRQAMRLSGNETTSEDLAQDTLVEAWRCLRRYNGRCQFFTWLCAIMLNRYRNWLRQNRATQRRGASVGADDAPGTMEHLVDPQSSPDEAAEARDDAGLPRLARSPGGFC